MPYGRGSRAAIDTQSRFRKRSALNAEMVSSRKRVKDSPHGKEFDTYKVGTTANSTSTMHKLASTPITLDCFETDDYQDHLSALNERTLSTFISEELIPYLEQLRQKYNETKDKRYWKELIRWLPNGWLQTRTVTLTYENVLCMLKQRSEHKLNEWSGKDNPENENFVNWAWDLPYAKEFFGEVLNNV